MTQHFNLPAPDDGVPTLTVETAGHSPHVVAVFVRTEPESARRVDLTVAQAAELAGGLMAATRAVPVDPGPVNESHREAAVRAAVFSIVTGSGDREQIIRDLLEALDTLSTVPADFEHAREHGTDDAHLLVADTRTGRVFTRPTYHQGSAAMIAGHMFPGWPAEQIGAAYGAWLSADPVPTETNPTVAERLMAAGGIVTGKTGPALADPDGPEQVVPLPRPSGLTPGGSCRVGGEPHDHPDTRQDHDDRRADLLADDLERDPAQARARTNAETVNTVRRALGVLTARRVLASSNLARITNARDALLRLSITN